MRLEGAVGQGRDHLTLWPFLVKKTWAGGAPNEPLSTPQPIRSPELHLEPNWRPLARPL